MQYIIYIYIIYIYNVHKVHAVRPVRSVTRLGGVLDVVTSLPLNRIYTKSIVFIYTIYELRLKCLQYII